FDLGVGQGTLLRLKHDRDRERFLAFREPRALVNIEQADLCDELAVDAAGGSGTASRKISKPAIGDRASSASRTAGCSSPKAPSALGPSRKVPARPGWYHAGGSAAAWMFSRGAPIAASAASA